METKHTPGPWINQLGIDGEPMVFADGALLAEPFGDTPAEREANARLIAAAPELLAESKENVRILENLISDLERIAGNPVIEGLRKRFAATIAAIAKAEGR